MSGFRQFELSGQTEQGLKDSGFSQPTEIQEQSISLAIKGEDVLGAAKTGSGKTLAFIVPILELLHKEKWTNVDGLGALVITPTRELAYQIFEVLKKVGKYHDVSAGLVIGGKDLKFERSRLSSCNIIICTPGRLLQHMDQNAHFQWDQLKILVLDEADRILDLGFSKTMNAIIENLPPERQTLLFSATQTKSVKQLARLSLKDPKFISVHENAETSTPESLQQSYIVCEQHEKLNVLWSFLKTHGKHKILVFMATCKQVKYTYELLCRLKPGSRVTALYGTLHQLKRMSIYETFCQKQHGVLIATDIASRGLDFPSVDWVVQYDCPEDVNTYIHRAGRTARYKKNGEALLFLLPSEETAMLRKLKDKKIPIESIEVNQRQMHQIERRAESFCAMDVNLKESAQRCFKAYIKNIFLMKDKEVFHYDRIDHNLYAKSLGLVVTPRVRFLEKVKGQTKADTSSKSKPTPKRPEKQIELLENDNDDEVSDDDLFTVKSTWKPDEGIDEEQIARQLEDLKQVSRSNKVTTKASVAKKLMKKKIKPNKKIVYGEDGEVIQVDLPKEQTSEKLKDLESMNIAGINIELAKEIMKDEDKIDKQLFREKAKQIRREKKQKEREQQQRGNKNVMLDTGDDDETYNAYIDDLPDPDKYFSGGESDGDEPSSKKRRELASSESEDDENDVDEEASDDESDHGIGLKEQEELALHLLSNR